MGEDPVPLGESLDRLLGRMGAGDSRSIRSIVSHWGDIVGAEVAAGTRVERYDGDRLVVSTTDPALASHLSWSEQAILGRVATHVDGTPPDHLDVHLSTPRNTRTG